MDLNSVSQLGRIEVEQEVTKNLTVKLRTLTAVEYSNVMRLTDPSDSDKPSLGTLGQLADLQIATLSFATVLMNGQSGSSDEFRKVYQNMQYPLLLEVYRVYMTILEKQNQSLEELKKNSTLVLP